MTTPQVTSEEIAKAREFLREVRAVCRKHGLGFAIPHGVYITGWSEGFCEIGCHEIKLIGSDIDLNEG